MKKKDCLIKKSEKREIIYNLINSGLPGILVLLGSLTNGNLTLQGIGLAVIASLIVFITKFKEYWETERKEYTTKLFSFVN